VQHLALRAQLLDDADAQLLRVGHLTTARHGSASGGREGWPADSAPPQKRAGCG
jgi:hypothetical protein